MKQYNCSYLQIKNNIENQFVNKKIPQINIGDNIKIKLKVREGNKNRVQMSEGIVISKKNEKINSSITIRKIIQNIGVERVYLVYSPFITDISIINSAKVRKSKLYYLRTKLGKAAKLKNKKVALQKNF
uniref:Large ribosomal subunit protein bL19c n=1 Tax=Caloglossa monosticha TaxID=76906 RepID=A0A1Z1M5D1_9FLOR|nr:ribosomal protein L19 [Caloglossa monosticha]ARW61120.1 ribosomal protein L19 [Caloglossa monosticha]